MLKHGKRLYFKSEEATGGDANRIPSPDNPNGVATTPQGVIDDGVLALNLKPPAKEFTKPTRTDLADATEGTARHVLLDGR
jgi:hypothetical protein